MKTRKATSVATLIALKSKHLISILVFTLISQRYENKISNNTLFNKNKTFKGIFRIMKICFILLFVFSFQLMALNTEAQEAVIELRTNSITVGQLIEEIEKQTDYLVVYSNREIDTDQIVNLRKKSDNVSAYLDEAFAGTDIGYDFENNYIVLMKKANRNASTIAEMIRSAQQQGKTITEK